MFAGLIIIFSVLNVFLILSQDKTPLVVIEPHPRDYAINLPISRDGNKFKVNGNPATVWEYYLAFELPEIHLQQRGSKFFRNGTPIRKKEFEAIALVQTYRNLERKLFEGDASKAELAEKNELWREIQVRIKQEKMLGEL